MSSKIFSKVALSVGLLSAGLLFSQVPANSKVRVEVGVLTCEVEGGTGFIVGSRKNMACLFQGVDGFRESYTGTVRKFGIDIGQTDRAIVKWAVFAPTSAMTSRALAGSYVGLSAEASVGLGVGANAMIGGIDNSIALQPFSGQAQEGLNIAVGIGTMNLR